MCVYKIQNKSRFFISHLIVLCFLIGSVGASTALAQNNLPADKKAELDAQKKDGKQKVKKTKRRRKRRKKRVVAPSPKESLKGYLGLHIDSDATNIVIGGDYLVPLAVFVKTWPRWSRLVFGGSYWSADGASVFTAEGGADAVFRLGRRMNYHGGLRLSYSYIGESTSVSKLYLTPVAGVDYMISKELGFIGAEFKLPLASRIGGAYALATYRIEF